MTENLLPNPERSSAERAYDAAAELVSGLGKERWISPGEFIEFIQNRARVDANTAQMVFFSYTSQGRVDESSAGVRNHVVNDGFDNSKLEASDAFNAQGKNSQYWGGAHFDY
jgi:hypothetical protein